MQLRRLTVFLTLLLCLPACSLWSADAPVVSGIEVSPSDTPLTTEAVMFSVAASSPAGLALQFRWIKRDSEGRETVLGEEQRVATVFQVPDTYFIGVEVTDGVNPVVNSHMFIVAVLPPDLTKPTGPCHGESEINPDSGLKLTVRTDMGGFFEFKIDDSDLPGDAESRQIRCAWGDDTYIASGRTPRHHYKWPGLYVVTVTVIDASSGSELAKAQKTIAISDADTDKRTYPKETVLPQVRKPVIGKIAGKFNFNGSGKPDVVSAEFKIELPAGFTITPTLVGVSIGNVRDFAYVDGKGKGGFRNSEPGSNIQQPDLQNEEIFTRIKKLKIKYPKLAAGKRTTATGQHAHVSVTLVSADLEEAGFNSEGLTLAARDSTPKIQIGFFIGGVGYVGEATVQFGLNSSRTQGIIKRNGGRSK